MAEGGKRDKAVRRRLAVPLQVDVKFNYVAKLGMTAGSSPGPCPLLGKLSRSGL